MAYAITIKERIRKYVDYIGISDCAFENAIGASHPFVMSDAIPNGKILSNILKVYNELSPEWLMTGEGSMLRTSSKHVAEIKATGAQVRATASTLSTQEPTPPYRGDSKETMVTIPASLLASLQQQLENKDAQIATLLTKIPTI